MSIAPIPPPTAMPTIEGIRPIEQNRQAPGNIGDSFSKALADARGLETESTKAAEKFAHGDPSMGIHEVVIAAEKANIAVRYATTLKNKAVEAYRELMNTQV